MALDTLGRDTVLAIIRHADDNEAIAITLTENLKRSDINPLDEAQHFHTLIHVHGIHIDHLAQSIGKSTSYIHTRLAIGNWPDYLTSALVNKTLNLTQCTEIARGQQERIMSQLFAWTLEMGANAHKIGQWRKELSQRLTTHTDAGRPAQDYEPPADPVAPRFDCPACYLTTTIDHQHIVSLCDSCYNLLQSVIDQGHFKQQQH